MTTKQSMIFWGTAFFVACLGIAKINLEAQADSGTIFRRGPSPEIQKIIDEYRSMEAEYLQEAQMFEQRAEDARMQAQKLTGSYQKTFLDNAQNFGAMAEEKREKARMYKQRADVLSGVRYAEDE